jgi:hypothetical protein
VEGNAIVAPHGYGDGERDQLLGLGSEGLGASAPCEITAKAFITSGMA